MLIHRGKYFTISLDNIFNICHIDGMGNMIIKGIPDELRNHFKAACAVRGETMREVLMRLMQEEVDKREKEKRK